MTLARTVNYFARKDGSIIYKPPPPSPSPAPEGNQEAQRKKGNKRLHCAEQQGSSKRLQRVGNSDTHQHSDQDDGRDASQSPDNGGPNQAGVRPESFDLTSPQPEGQQRADKQDYCDYFPLEGSNSFLDSLDPLLDPPLHPSLDPDSVNSHSNDRTVPPELLPEEPENWEDHGGQHQGQ